MEQKRKGYYNGVIYRQIKTKTKELIIDDDLGFAYTVIPDPEGDLELTTTHPEIAECFKIIKITSIKEVQDGLTQ